MSDTISREKAIATVFRMHDSCDTYDITDYRDMMVEALKVLPSEEPDRLVRCRECIWKDLACEFYETQGDNGYCRDGRSKDGRSNIQVESD